MTNGDFIRSLSDEDLAFVVMCEAGYGFIQHCLDKDCYKCALKWLKQPCNESDYDYLLLEFRRLCKGVRE